MKLLTPNLFEDCLDCPRRKVGCKTGCPDYEEARAKLDAINAAREEERLRSDLFHGTTARERRRRTAINKKH